jgi:hypothetical protein
MPRQAFHARYPRGGSVVSGANRLVIAVAKGNPKGIQGSASRLGPTSRLRLRARGPPPPDEAAGR